MQIQLNSFESNYFAKTFDFKFFDNLSKIVWNKMNNNLRFCFEAQTDYDCSLKVKVLKVKYEKENYWHLFNGPCQDKSSHVELFAHSKIADGIRNIRSNETRCILINATEDLLSLYVNSCGNFEFKGQILEQEEDDFKNNENQMKIIEKMQSLKQNLCQNLYQILDENLETIIKRLNEMDVNIENTYYEIKRTNDIYQKSFQSYKDLPIPKLEPSMNFNEWFYFYERNIGTKNKLIRRKCIIYYLPSAFIPELLKMADKGYKRFKVELKKAFFRFYNIQTRVAPVNNKGRRRKRRK